MTLTFAYLLDLCIGIWILVAIWTQWKMKSTSDNVNKLLVITWFSSPSIDSKFCALVGYALSWFDGGKRHIGILIPFWFWKDVDSYFFNSWMTLYWMTRLLNCMALLDEKRTPVAARWSLWNLSGFSWIFWSFASTNLTILIVACWVRTLYPYF